MPEDRRGSRAEVVGVGPQQRPVAGVEEVGGSVGHKGNDELAVDGKVDGKGVVPAPTGPTSIPPDVVEDLVKEAIVSGEGELALTRLDVPDKADVIFGRRRNAGPVRGEADRGNGRQVFEDMKLGPGRGVDEERGPQSISDHNRRVPGGPRDACRQVACAEINGVPGELIN